MTNLFFVQKKNFKYDLLRIIQNLQGKYIILCTSTEAYTFLKKRISKYPIILYDRYFKKSMGQKIFEIFSNFFSNRRSFFKFLFSLKLLKYHKDNLEYLINKYQINKIVTDEIKFNIFGMSLKKILTKNPNIILNYIYMYPFQDDSIGKYNSTQLKKVSFEYIFYMFLKNKKEAKDMFYNLNNKIFYYFRPSVILISRLLNLNPDIIFSRVNYYIFKKIFFIREDVKKSVEKSIKRYSKSKRIKFYNIFKPKKIKSNSIYKVMVSTAPYSGHKTMQEGDDKKLFFSLLKMISKNVKQSKLLSIHPNQSYEEKIFYTNLAKKFNFEVSHGGKIVEDLSNSEICIAQPYGSVIDHCIFMKKKFLSFSFPYEKKFFPTEKYNLGIKEYIKIYKNRKYVEKFLFRSEIEFVKKFKELSKNKSKKYFIILAPDKLKMKKI